MRSYVNPFRVPHSERLREDRTFLRTFGVPMLDVLPEDPWETPIIVRSPQGGGKTSLLRIFTSESLSLVTSAPDDYPQLAAKLSALHAIGPSGPAHLGVLLNLERDYRDLADVGAPEEVAQRLFFKLLDSRIIVSILRAALESQQLIYPEDVNRLIFRTRREMPGAEEVLSRLGGPTGSGLFEAAKKNEMDLLNLLDSLRAVEWRREQHGHSDLYSFRVLSDCDILIDGKHLERRPLVLLDDGHFLARSQRNQLLRRLAARDLNVGRWYSERFEALSPQEVMAEVGMQGRDHFLVELSANYPSTPRARRLPYDRIASEVADSRSSRALGRYADEFDHFTELITVSDSEFLGNQPNEVLRSLDEKLTSLIGHEDRYSRWLAEARSTGGYAGAVARREIEILITRDRRRPQRELFDMLLEPAEVQKRSSSAVREAAMLFLASEFRLPLYAGPKTIVRLGSYNMAQFINLCADLFDEMLGSITLRKKPRLAADRQDVLIRQASDRLWREIPQRLPAGRSVQHLLLQVAALAHRETYRPNAPYAPGVTGIAITMADRNRLLDANRRAKLPSGAEELAMALGSAIIDNMLTAELDRSVKGENVMVLYLNRLLCPRFRLPLGRGGFQVLRLPQLCSWMLDPAPSVPSNHEQLSF